MSLERLEIRRDYLQLLQSLEKKSLVDHCILARTDTLCVGEEIIGQTRSGNSDGNGAVPVMASIASGTCGCSPRRVQRGPHRLPDPGIRR